MENQTLQPSPAPKPSHPVPILIIVLLDLMLISISRVKILPRLHLPPLKTPSLPFCRPLQNSPIAPHRAGLLTKMPMVSLPFFIHRVGGSSMGLGTSVLDRKTCRKILYGWSVITPKEQNPNRRSLMRWAVNSKTVALPQTT